MATILSSTVLSRRLRIIIVKVEPVFISKYLYVRIETDTGLVGYGESGSWGFLEASASIVTAFREYLIGQDPLKIEFHWQYLYNAFCFRGATIMGALGAIDIALWDIAGKFFRAPTYCLLGGGDKQRDKVRAYLHVKSPNVEESVRLIREAKAMGFTAVGHLNPFLDPARDSIGAVLPISKKILEAANNVAKFREAAGNDMDLCLEIHRRLDIPQAVMLAKEIEAYRPMFYEDPIKAENIDSMAILANKISLPIATGERLLNIQEFAMLFTRDATRYARVSVCAVGGLTPAKKIAALAEAFGVMVVPHNPGNLSPISTAACIQLCAAIPNLAIMELPADEESSIKRTIVQSAVRVEHGYMTIPESSGIGATLNEAVLNDPTYAHTQRCAKAIILDDGSCTNR
jgi:galactonate dehydratase